MARFAFVAVFFVGLFCNIHAEGSEDDGAIDLSKYGPKIFGQPSTETGDLIAKWNSSMKGNPDEMGSYFEGDILHPSAMMKSGLRYTSSRWPKGIVPYYLPQNYYSQYNFDANQTYTILSAMEELSKTTCIKFVPRTSERDYIDIRNEGSGCWSSIGRIGGPQTVNLQRPGCVSSKGIVLHELMHAIGIIHEHNRPERDEYIGIIYNNIARDALGDFTPTSEDILNDYGIDYDYGSIMHYSRYAASANGLPTILPYEPCVEIGQRNGLSPSDIRKVRAMYKCK